MFEVRRILCPVDLSESSRGALQYSARLAHWYGAGIHVLHVDPALPTLWRVAPSLDSAASRAATPAAANTALATFVHPIRDAGVSIDAHVALGDVAARILDYARHKRTDLIVMGTHGRGGLERLVLGSVAERVLREASCPVMTTRRADAPFLRDGPPFRSIVCSVDFSPPSLAALRRALSLAAEADARLTLLHVLAPVDHPMRVPLGWFLQEGELRQRLHAALPAQAGDWCRPSEVVARGEVHKETLRVAQSCAADLIVMGVHGRNTLDVRLFGSNTVRVVRTADCPVLTVGASRPASRLDADAVHSVVGQSSNNGG
jgi:nucleotide-binding universal stress UspA family protein